jgi:nitroreductase
MEYFEVLEKRQSIRKYQSLPIEPEKREAILKAASRRRQQEIFKPTKFM